MLDLSVLYNNNKFFEVKLLDGTMLNIMKPSIDFLAELESYYENQGKKIDIKKIGAITEEMTTKILNNNKESIQIEQNYVKQLGFDVQLIIINNYSKFTRELMANPN